MNTEVQQLIELSAKQQLQREANESFCRILCGAGSQNYKNICDMEDLLCSTNVTRAEIAKARDNIADMQRTLADADGALVDLAASLVPEQ